MMEIVVAMFARRRPLLPSLLSLVTVTKVLQYFNVVLFSCRYQAHIANQMVNIFPKWSLLDVTSDKSRLSKVFRRELSIILSHVSVTSNDRWVFIVNWSVPVNKSFKIYMKRMKSMTKCVKFQHKGTAGWALKKRTFDLGGILCWSIVLTNYLLSLQSEMCTSTIFNVIFHITANNCQLIVQLDIDNLSGSKLCFFLIRVWN